MNVVILAIIVIVVLIIVLIILVGGTGQFIKAVQNIFTGRISAQSLELATKDCEQLCDSGKALSTTIQGRSPYCTKTFVVELDKRLLKVNCGGNANPISEITPEEKSKGITGSSSLGVACDIACTGV